MSVNMTTQVVAVGDNWTKVGNDYIGSSPNGATSGGTAALAWSAPSGLADGNTLTITTDGTYSFGTKAQAAPVIYDFGDYAYENGALNSRQGAFADGFGIQGISGDVDAIWTKNSPTSGSSHETYLTTEKSRFVGSTRSYRFDGTDGYLGWPAAYGGGITPNENDKLYVSWYYNNDINQHKYFEFGYVDQVGSFNVGDSVSIAAYPAFEATILGFVVIDGIPSMAFRVENTGGLSGSGWDGQFLVNDTTGGTATLNTIVGSGGWGLSGGGFTKFLRIWEEQAGTQGIRFSWTQHAIGAGGSTYYDYQIPDDTWVHMEVEMDAGTMSGSGYINGTKIADFTIQGDNTNLAAKSPTVALLGFEGKQRFNGAYGADIYMDSAFNRVVLGDAATYASCTATELQNLTAWSSTSISAAIYKGALTGQMYLYVIGANGAPINTSGVII